MDLDLAHAIADLRIVPSIGWRPGSGPPCAGATAVQLRGKWPTQ
jgi:hypothetical protein